MSETVAKSKETKAPPANPLWFKDAVIYELHVRAFQDSNGDGIGDFDGLRQRLDYLQDLGVDTLWLLPFYPSPLKDDGYDIADYAKVHPDYGTLQDFKEFLRAAHRRGLRVITELVLNHTSDQHVWFRRARRAKPGDAWRDFYVWSDTPDRYREARVIFKDFEVSNWTWDPVAKAYFWHRFYSHQPDLNFDNPRVRKAMLRIVDFWLRMGVDGLRLDAVPYLQEREGTSCENLPETHEFLKELRRHVEERFQDRMFLAEANQWPEDAAAYFGAGDECHMAFHFPVMPRLFMAIRMEDRYPVVDILQQTPAIPENCQWAMFLRNHDELTLEMVTDEDRDYMYRVYAHDPRARINLGIRRRLAPLLGNERRKIELMHGLLFSLPGTPVLYYGDEIGMGDNVWLPDRNGVRTPVQWSADRNAGFSRANPQRLYLPVNIDPEYHYEAVNVEAQQNNTSSLLWWIKRLIALRRAYKAFGRGSLEFLFPENPRVLAFVRRHGDERVLVLANLSRYVQYVELDLSAHAGLVPVELFGRTSFPPVTDRPYFLTMGPHAFFWFLLEPPPAPAAGAPASSGELPSVSARDRWEAAFRGRAGAAADGTLMGYLKRCRWFGGKALRLRSARVVDAVPVGDGAEDVRLMLVRVEYGDAEPELYLLPLAFATGTEAERLAAERPQALVARVRVSGRGEEPVEGVVHECVGDEACSGGLIESIARRRRIRGQSGELFAASTPELRSLWAPGTPRPKASLLKAEQSNSSILYENRMVLKLFRRVHEGVNPELEVTRFLMRRTSFRSLPPLAGALEYRRATGELLTVGILQGFVANHGDAWQHAQDSLSRYVERIQVLLADPERARLQPPPIPASVLDLEGGDPPELARDAIGTFLGSAALIGKRTAELHVALASDAEDPNFAPEPFTPHYQRSLYESMRAFAQKTLRLLRRRVEALPEDARKDARALLELEKTILERLRAGLTRPLAARRIRIHGDYHLAQVLNTGKDFVILDFEGEPARSIGERRIKRSPLRDVAGMLRSFHYASVCALTRGGRVRPEDLPVMEPWMRFWTHWVSVTFLRAYLEAAWGAGFLPRTQEELRAMLELYVLDKAVYELQYELNNRPDWVRVPLWGLLQLLRPGEAAAPGREAAGGR
jgi:maltose alpha-D-glucosyltransferase/alpha-amylase